MQTNTAPMQVGQTTIKEVSFLTRPLRDITLDQIPGLGQATIQKLVGQGIDTTIKFMGKFMMCNADPVVFDDWLENSVGMRKQDVVKYQISQKMYEKCRQIIGG